MSTQYDIHYFRFAIKREVFVTNSSLKSCNGLPHNHTLLYCLPVRKNYDVYAL